MESNYILFSVAMLLVGMNVGLLVAWVILSRKQPSPTPDRQDAPVQTAAPAGPEEAERQRLIAEQRAFTQMLGYNADVAYGRAKLPDDERGV